MATAKGAGNGTGMGATFFQKPSEQIGKSLSLDGIPLNSNPKDFSHLTNTPRVKSSNPLRNKIMGSN